MDTQTLGLLAVALLNVITAALTFIARRDIQDVASKVMAVKATAEEAVIKVDTLGVSVNGRISQLLEAKAETAVAQVAAARSEGIAEGQAKGDPNA